MFVNSTLSYEMKDRDLVLFGNASV